MIRTDELLKNEVVRQLAWDSRVDSSQIEVTVNEGRVTLNGTVPFYMAKLAAAADALSVVGVGMVDNKLSVENTSRPPEDIAIKHAIVSSLIWNPYVMSHKFDLTVDKGWVTIEGIVEAYWKKMEAENTVAKINGVLGITNKIAVVTTDEVEERVVDKAIAEDVVNALDRNSKVFIDDVNVKVDDGTVILSGSVPTWEARSAAYDSAIYTFGVTNVNNNIIVTPINA